MQFPIATTVQEYPVHILSEPERNDLGLIGPYTPLALLGHGGMGVVYYCKDFSGSPAAVKLIAPLHSGSEEARKRFRQEIISAKRVRSPWVGKIIAEDLGNDRWWYASEYVPGLNIAQAVVQNGGRLPDKTVRKLIHFMALGLRDIHRENIVHRDLKPQNVMISPDGVRIIDFGIAYSNSDPHLTATNEVVGTPAYMCVEQMRKDNPSPSWDIFALGNLVTFMLTGRTAFDMGDNSPHTIRNNILNNKRDLSGVPREFRPLVEACLNTDPNARPSASGIPRLLGYEPTATMPKTLFLPDGVETAIKKQDVDSNMTAIKMQALKPVPRSRKPGESNRDWEARNRTYRNEMRIWARAEAKRRRRARWVGFKRTAPKAAAILVMLAIAFTAGMLQPNDPAWLDDLKEQIPQIPDIAEAAPQPSQGPRYEQPQVKLHSGTFTAVKNPGSTRDPDAKGSSIAITGIEASGSQVKVSVAVSGFAGHGDAPFTDSCVTVKSGSTIEVKPTTYSVSGEKDGARTGTITYSMAFQGVYTFHQECNQDKSVSGVRLGEARAVNLGTVKYNTIVVPIMGRQQDGKDLVVSVINGGNESSQFCLRSHGAYKRPYKVAQVKSGDIPMSELTFDNTSGGTLYTSCSERNHRVSPNGSGVKVG